MFIAFFCTKPYIRLNQPHNLSSTARFLGVCVGRAKEISKGVMPCHSNPLDSFS
jgi:hypothetical protein